jgi:hypothetical protein
LTRRTQSYLAELINERNFSNDKDEKRDLLSNLVSANDELLGDGEQRLGEEELIGTCFALRYVDLLCETLYCSGNALMFYLAGHDVRPL